MRGRISALLGLIFLVSCSTNRSTLSNEKFVDSISFETHSIRHALSNVITDDSISVEIIRISTMLPMRIEDSIYTIPSHIEKLKINKGYHRTETTQNEDSTLATLKSNSLNEYNHTHSSNYNAKLPLNPTYFVALALFLLIVLYITLKSNFQK